MPITGIPPLWQNRPMSDAATIIATIISTGLALAGLVLYLFRWLRQDNQVLRQEIRQDIDSVRQEVQSVRQDLRETEARLNSRIDAVNSRIDSLISLFTRPGSAA